MSLISDLVTGALSPILNTVAAIFTKKEDVSLEKFRIDGTVDLSLVAAHVSIIQAQASLLKSQWMMILQFGFGFPLMIYYGKCILWDKVLALGSTDPLKGDISTFSMWIVSFLFLHSAITEWTRRT